MATQPHGNKQFGDWSRWTTSPSSNPHQGQLALLDRAVAGVDGFRASSPGSSSADSVEVHIEGTEATHLPAQKRNVGFVFQHYAAFKHMTVAKNVAFGLEIRKRPKDEVKRRVEELLDLVHLSQFSHRLPSQLSGGQRQRMALARALAVEPKVLLLDEPFGALDAKVRKELRDWLRRLHDEVHVTTVFVTHDQEEALEVADEIAVINDGRIEQVGSPDELYDRPANDFVMSFLGPVTTIGGQLVRPHDIDLANDGNALGSVPGVITRIQRVGFEVRVSVRTDVDDDVVVMMTKAHARGLENGSKVWLTTAKGALTVPAMGPTLQPGVLSEDVEDIEAIA